MKAPLHFEPIISNQQSLLYACLSKFLSRNSVVALLDFPNHNNVGDNAIWLGEKSALKTLGVRVKYQCDLYSFSEKALRTRLGKDGIILLHGGGNLGSVWPEHQKFREKIIKLFPDKKIIQLPQSVHFDNEEDRVRFKEVAKAHQNLLILLRDTASFEILKQSGLKVELCPDMALALGPVSSIGRPVVDIVWLARTDHESAFSEQHQLNCTIEKLDWLYGEPGKFYSKWIMRFTVRVRRIVQKLYQRSVFLRDYFGGFNSIFFDWLAQSRFNRGIRILSRGKIVMTDRLHGHILSTLLGKPQILFDNHYRKIGNYLDCFVASRDAFFYMPESKTNLNDCINKALEIAKNEQHAK